MKKYEEYVNVMLKKITSFSDPDMSSVIHKYYLENKSYLPSVMKKLENKIFCSVTAIIICRDEERCIERCISSILLNDFNEIIIIDTGSRDKTLDIILEYEVKYSNIKVLQINWDNDFSYVRNIGIHKAKSEWIFFIDADEYLVDCYGNDIREALTFFDPFLSNKVCICPVIINSDTDLLLTNPRLQKKMHGYKYYGAVHETLRLCRYTYEFVPYLGIDIKLKHDGYQPNVFEEKKKEERNHKLLEINISMESNNPIWYCYMVRDCSNLISYDQQVSYLEKALKISENRGSEYYNYIYIWSLFLIVKLYISSDKVEKAEDALKLMKEKTNTNSPDVFYLEQKIELLKTRILIRNNLNATKEYRRKSPNTLNSFINSEGYHLDEIIVEWYYLDHKMGEYYKYKEFLCDMGYLYNREEEISE